MTNNSSGLQVFLDELTQLASREDRKSDLLEARQDYFHRLGDVFEDDRQFEPRMASFLDWYVFDRKHPVSRRSPVQELYMRYVAEGNNSQSAGFRGLTETTPGLFHVDKVSSSNVLVTDVFSKLDHWVTERRTLKGIDVGDVIETRLLPFGGEILFSQALCVHPKASVPFIMKEATLRARAGEAARMPFVWECAKMSLKVDRYRQIAVEKIYDFKNRRI